MYMLMEISRHIGRPGKWVGSIGFGFDPCGFESNGFGLKNGSS
jgi:hypothetical protein